MKIGVQLFTVRKQAQKDLKATLKELADIGLKHVEAARISFSEQDADTFCEANDKYGTTVSAVQIKYHILRDEFSSVRRFLEKTNCNVANISVLPTEYIAASDANLIEFANDVNDLSKKYADIGCRLCYHHHDFEFFKSERGTRLNMLYEFFAPEVKFIIDTYWATRGGFSASELINTFSGRVEGVHLRDYALKRNFFRSSTDCALGDGNINFDNVIKAAAEAGASYAAIEQKTKNPYAELKKSVEELHRLSYGDLLK